MITIYDLKPRFQNLLRPVCNGLARIGVTANQVTVSAMLLSIAVGALFALNPSEAWAAFLVPAALFVRMALNAIDGMLAREHGMQSPLGGILNELGDVVSDAALYLPFAFVPGIDPAVVVAAVLLALLTEFAGIVAVPIGASRRYDGPMGKSDRAFVFGALALALGLGFEPSWWGNAVVAVVGLLSIVTVINRSRRALAELADDTPESN